MRYFLFPSKCVVLLAIIACTATRGYGQDDNKNEITGFYQQYRNFSLKTGISTYDFPATKLKGGGFTYARNIVPWFAMWTQFSFFGSVEQASGLKIRIIHNLEGLRWQKQRGPFCLYAKAGLGFANYGIDYQGQNIGGETKLSLAYGGGVQIWLASWIGIDLDISHAVMGVPNLTDLDGRDKWDSGLTYTPGVTIRF